MARTAKQRAASKRNLIKARARRRRSRNVRVAASLAGVTGVGVGVVLGHKHLRGNPAKRGATIPVPQAAIGWSGRTRGNPNPVAERTGVFKQAARGGGFETRNRHPSPYYVKRNRPAYDARRRGDYVPKKRTNTGARLKY